MANYAVDQIPNSTGCLTITQRYEFGKAGLDAPCEPGENLTCQRYRALVTYKYIGNTNQPFSVTVAQRNQFTVDDVQSNSPALFRDCDRPLVGCLSTPHLVFKDRLNPLFNEYYSAVVFDGKDTHAWDNMHQTWRGRVTEPAEVGNFSLSGCPECLHTHWRWSASLSEHFGAGKLLLPKNTKQDLSVGIVLNRVGEERPEDFSNLISLSNPESIRSPATGNYNRMQEYRYSVPKSVVYWLMGRGKSDSDEFFGYYSFFNPDTQNVVRPISGGTEQAISQDQPSEITFAHLFEEGETIYNEIDPNTIAQLPSGYTAFHPVSYDVRTEAEVSGPHIVKFSLPSVGNQTTFDNLRILHSEPDPYDPTQAVWVDRTILGPDSPAPDFANRQIYAKVNEVGPFLIASYTAPPPNTNVADLSVAVSDSADPVTAGNQMTYALTLTNNGPNTATDVILTNGLSPDVTFESVNTPQGVCREEESMVMCKLGPLASGASVNVSVVVRVYEGQTRFPTGGKGISNTAVVLANEGDPDETNNSDTEETNALPQTVAPPSVEIQVPTK